MSSDFLSKDIVYVNSKNRISGESNDFVVNIGNQITYPNRYTHATLINFACPKSYYLFNSTNNSFVVSENGVTRIVSISEGNYNTSTLLFELSSKLNIGGYTYAVTLNTRTGKLAFTVSGNGLIQPIFNFTDSQGCEEILGFELDSYQFSGNALSSVSVINMQLTQTVQLLTNIVKNNIISTIIPNSVDFGYILYNEQNPAYASHELISNGINSAHFWLLDGNTGKKLDLNGQEFNFSIVLYEKNDYYEKILFDKKINYIIDELNNSTDGLEKDK